MAQYNTLKSAIQAVIRENGENEITGYLLQSSLLSMINSLGAGYQFVGIATPSTNPGTPDQNVFYIASKPGPYSNFSSLAIQSGEVSVLYWNGTWHKAETGAISGDAVDDEITELRLDVFGQVEIEKNYNWSDGYLGSGWEIKSSTTSQFSQPVFCKAGEVLKYKTGNNYSYAVAKVHDDTPISVGSYDFVESILITASANTEYTYTFEEDMYIVISVQKSNYTVSVNKYKDNSIDKRLTTVELEQLNERSWYQQPSAASYAAIYNDCISELYIKPESLEGIKRIILKCYNGNLYVVAQNSQNVTVWECLKDISAYSSASNGKIKTLKATTAGGSVSANEMVGYIVFSDAETFKNTSDTTSASLLNISNAIQLERNRLISAALEATPIYELGQSDTINDTYEACLKELVILARNGIDRVSVKAYNNSLYVDSRLGNTAKWSATLSLADKENNTVISIVATTAGADISVGDVVGYIIFSDIDTFKSTSYASVAWVDLVRASSFDLNPTIWNSLLVQKSEVDSLVNTKLYGRLSINIPSLIYAIAGTELNIWNDAIALSVDKGLMSPTNYQVRWECAKGYVTDRCFRYLPTDGDAGHDYSCICRIYDTGFNLLLTKGFTIRVKAKNALASSKNIAFFGDSLGASSATKLYNLFRDNSRFTGTIPTMVGTRGSAPKYDAVGGFGWYDYATKGSYAYRVTIANTVSAALGSVYSINIGGSNVNLTIRELNTQAENILLEAAYGARVNNFPATGVLTKVSGAGDASISFTNGAEESGNPLWNDQTQQLDVAQYKALCGLGSGDNIDAASFMLGINGAFNETTITGYISALYNAFISANASCKLIVALPPSCGNDVNGYGANYGAGGAGYIDYKEKMEKFKQLYIKLRQSGDYPNLRLAIPGLQVDRYYGYDFGSRDISQAYTTTERYHNNYVHPGDSGYSQIGDAFLAAFVAVLTE